MAVFTEAQQAIDYQIVGGEKVEDRPAGRRTGPEVMFTWGMAHTQDGWDRPYLYYESGPNVGQEVGGTV